MTSIEDLVDDPLFAELDSDKRNQVFDLWFDDNKDTTDQYDRLITKSLFNTQDSYHKETESRKPFVQQGFNSLRQLNSEMNPCWTNGLRDSVSL